MPFSTRRGIAAVALALLVAADAVAQAEEGDERVNEAVEDPFDPFEGMDANGRIPRPERPPGIEHPRRWRYIPEGRIKSGNVFQRFLVSSAIVPFIFRDEDVGFGGGVALTDIDFRQQRRREFLGAFVSYSAQGQQSYTFAWRRWVHSFDLPEGGVLQEERSFWRASAGYRKTRTRRFYGFGPDTDEDDETSYTDERVEFELGVQASYPDPGDDLILRLGLRGDFHDLSDGAVKGVPSTEEEFPRVFASAENDDLGWLEVGAAWDTRDSQRNPYRGWLL
ncbi:MAG: hypothetical protein O7A09_14075, partial [Proteobacteria bacterium]|nr:hypothetical protein [Pseudomonadota bacterium]